MPSQVTFHGKYVNISDGDATFILQMLLEALTKTKSDHWSGHVRSKWERRLSGCGFGLYELDLEKLITNAQEKQRMLEVFDAAKKIIKAYGPYVKKELLNSMPHGAAIYFEDQDTSWFLGKLDEIEGLLKAWD